MQQGYGPQRVLVESPHPEHPGSIHRCSGSVDDHPGVHFSSTGRGPLAGEGAAGLVGGLLMEVFRGCFLEIVEGLDPVGGPLANEGSTS